MATINEITQGQSYTGNAALGGYIPEAIQIDTNPVMQLAAYTAKQNEVLYNQRVKDTEDKIAQLAALSQLNINDAVGKDREAAMKAYDTVHQTALEQARMRPPRTPQEKLEREAALQLKLKEAKNIITSVNARGLTYKTLENQINEDGETNAEEKALAKKQLQEKFNNTEWYEKVPALEKYDVQIAKLGEPLYGENTAVIKVGNRDVTQKYKYFAAGKTLDASATEAMGMDAPLPPNATPEQIRERDAKLAKGGDQKKWNDAANFLTEAIASGNYLDANGKLDLNKLRNENPMAAGIYDLAQRSNQYNQEMLEHVKNGYFTTRLNQKVPLPPGMTAKDFHIIDTNKPLTPAQVIYLGKFGKAAPDMKEDKVEFTGEELKKQALAVDWFNARTSRINANKPSASGTGTTTGGSDQTALLFGEHVNRLKNYFVKNNNQPVKIHYDKTDEITRKALGLTPNTYVVYNPDGTAIVGVKKDGTGGTPLTIEQQKNNFVVAVKGGSKEEAQMDAKFQEEQETGLNKTFGTTDAVTIWGNWGEPQGVAVKTSGTTPAKKVETKQADLRQKYNY